MTKIHSILLAMGLYKGLCALSAGIASLCPGALAFTPGLRNESPSHRFSFDRNGLHHQTSNLILGNKRSFFRLGAEPNPSMSSEEKEELLETIRSMRVKELKTELEERKISTKDVFEKEELVKRLYNARLASLSPPKKYTKKSSSKTTSKRNTDPNVIRGDLSSISFDRYLERSLGSKGMRVDKETARLLPIVTIQVIRDNGDNYPLKLILDTGCSGVIIASSTFQKHNMMQSLWNPSVSMHGVLGAIDSKLKRSTTLIEFFTIGSKGENSNSNRVTEQTLGPLLAVSQDISTLEILNLDGFLGLWFLDEYKCIELDLENSEIALYKTESQPPYDDNDLEIVAEGNLSRTKSRLWTVDTIFDIGGGIKGKPVKMLFDTGATITQLSWKGLQDGLGLSRTSPQVQPEKGARGWGVGGKMKSLNHKIEIDRPIRLGSSPSSYNGLSISQGKKVKVHVGDLPIVDEGLAEDNVGGILGMNILSKASMIRMVFCYSTPRITLFQKKRESPQEL